MIKLSWSWGFILVIIVCLSTIIIMPVVNSTVLILQDADTENREDVRVDGANPDSNTGGITVLTFSSDNHLVYIKFNITQLLNVPGQKIYNSTLILNPESSTLTGYNSVKAHHVYTQDWNELVVTFNNQPCGSLFDQSAECNLTGTNISTGFIVAGQGGIWNITTDLQQAYDSGNANFSLVLKVDPVPSGALSWHAKEHATVGARPILRIEYSAAPDPCDYTSGDYNIDASDNCVLTDDASLPANTLNCYGTGTLTILADIVVGKLIKSNGCNIITKFGDGKELMVKL